MAPFCLIQKHADEFLEKIKSGEFDAAKLMSMTSAERHAAFADVLGEANAGPVNAAFESKLLLKNQQQGITNWIKQTTEGKPAIQRDLLARVARMEKVLEPKEMNGFLADLAKQKLGFGVTMEEAGIITELSKAASDAKAANNWEEYVVARSSFKEYTDRLTVDAQPMTPGKGLVAGVRAGALSWPTTIVKLLGAWSSAITTPATDAVALGVANVLPKLAKGAPRYGTTDPVVALKAQAAGLTAMFTDGITDMGRMFLNKPSRLDLLHSERPAVHAWYEYSGSLHGGLKEPIRRAEYARSLYRRTAESLKEGEDPKDITVMMRNSTGAFKDANRVIFMDDNIVAKGWNATLRRLDQVDPTTGKANPVGAVLSTTLQMEMPIVKAPANIVADASEHIAGLLTGPSKAAWHYAKGLEGLKPVERDAIIRQISKGSVGAALMTLYYFKRDQIEMGGFYEEGEKRKPSDVQAMGMRIGGHDVPKALLHNAVIYPLQYAATMGRVLDAESKVKGEVDAEGVRSAFVAASLGLINEAPLVGSLTKDARSFLSAKSVDEFVSKKVASMAVPGLVQWVATKTDNDRKVAPKGIKQHLEANIPGLRKNVPTKKVK